MEKWWLSAQHSSFLTCMHQQWSTCLKYISYRNVFNSCSPLIKHRLVHTLAMAPPGYQEILKCCCSDHTAGRKGTTKGSKSATVWNVESERHEAAASGTSCGSRITQSGWIPLQWNLQMGWREMVGVSRSITGEGRKSRRVGYLVLASYLHRESSLNFKHHLQMRLHTELQKDTDRTESRRCLSYNFEVMSFASSLMPTTLWINILYKFCSYHVNTVIICMGWCICRLILLFITYKYFKLL